jgi:hypothetical protein
MTGEARAAPAAQHARVLAIIHDPVAKRQRGRKLHQVLGWNDPDELARRYSADDNEVSYGLVSYEIAERVEVDGFPTMANFRAAGFTLSLFSGFGFLLSGYAYFKELS